MKPTKYLIKTQTLQFFELVVKFLHPKMIHSHRNAWTDTAITNAWNRNKGNRVVCVHVEENGKLMVNHSDEEYYRTSPTHTDAVWVTWETLFEKFKEQITTEILLTDQYNAIVEKGKDYIRVGCQTIPIGKVREVLLAWEKLNPSVFVVDKPQP